MRNQSHAFFVCIRLMVASFWASSFADFSAEITPGYLGAFRFPKIWAKPL
jgi:hypothetical protein